MNYLIWPQVILKISKKFFFLVFLLFIILIVAGPVIVLFFQSAMMAVDGKIDFFYLILPLGRRLSLFFRTVFFALSVSLAGVFLAILSGTLLWRLKKGFLSYFKWFLLVLGVVPPYIHAMAWLPVINTINFYYPVEPFFASFWVQLMALLPFSTGLVLLGLESADGKFIEAALIFHSDLYVLKKIVLPLARPFIIAGGVFIFLLSLLDYTVPSLFGINLYSLEIFAEYGATGEPERGFLLSVPLLIISLSAVIFSLKAFRNMPQSPLWKTRKKIVLSDFPFWFVILQFTALFVLILEIGVPLATFLLTSWGAGNIILSVSQAGEDIIYTFLISFFSALASLPIALFLTAGLAGRKKRGYLWWILITIPLTMPAPLIGIGLISIWNHPFFSAFYGTSLMPVLAGTGRFASLASIILLIQFRQIDPLLIDAARIIQHNHIKTWLQVRIPLIIPGLAAAFFAVFALTLGELGATLIVLPPGRETLTVRIYNYMHYGASGTVAGLCLVMTLVTIFAGVIAVFSLMRWSALLPEKEEKKI